MTSPQPGELEVTGLSAAQIDAGALEFRLELHELTPQQASLEQAFMAMTDDLAVLVEHGVTDLLLGGRPGLRRRAGSAHQAADPGDDLLQAERFGDVVIAAGSDADEPVLHLVAGGAEQHRDVRISCPQPVQYLESVDVGSIQSRTTASGWNSRVVRTAVRPSGPVRTSQPS